MLIPLQTCLRECKKPIRGILHVGAHECEEQPEYDKIGLTIDKVLWFEAMSNKVETYKKLGYDIYNLVVSDKDNEIVKFNITNNGQSSSFLEMDTHLKQHPHVVVITTVEMITTTLKTFIEKNNVNIDNYNMLNLDIQGAELKALKGMGAYIEKMDYIYTEVNTNTLYKDCALLPEIDDFLQQYGFIRKITSMTPHEWGDAFYVKVD
jgi:FkbM family methyltransferase